MMFKGPFRPYLRAAFRLAWRTIVQRLGNRHDLGSNGVWAYDLLNEPAVPSNVGIHRWVNLARRTLEIEIR